MNRTICGLDTRKLWMISGVYQIRCETTGKVYIGRTKNLARRIRRHVSKLNRNIHKNKYLQYAWNKYKEDGFNISVLELCNNDELKDKELYYFKKTRCCDRNFGYNMVKTSNGGYCSGADHYLYGKSLPDVTKKKLSESHKWVKGKNHNMFGIPKSNTIKAKISKSMKGKMTKENHPSSKLRQLDVDLIRQRRVGGESCKNIAKDFNVSTRHVYRLCSGESW